MKQIDIILLIILGSALILGALIFFLSGIYKVKKDRVMVIEKLEQFYGLYSEGTYFFMPLIYKRKGVYTIVKMEKDVRIEGLREMTITYQVVDVKKYHYYDGDVTKCVEETYKNNPDLDEETLRAELEGIGIKYLGIRAK